MFDNHWSHGRKHFKWSAGAVPLGRRETRLEIATVDQHLGPEVIAVILDATDRAIELGHAVLKVGIDLGITPADAGRVPFLLWWVPPVVKGKPFALFGHVLNPSDPRTLDLLQRVFSDAG